MPTVEPIQPSSPPSPESAILKPTDQWEPRIALERVKRNFGTDESYRRLNHDWRWKSADELYLGWVQQRYWEGTKIPRSSLSVYLTLEHVESMLPKVLSALFGETYWFDARPYPATSMAEARAVQELLLAQARSANNGTGIREVLRRACKSGLLYGNGIFHLGWQRGTEQKVITIDELRPITAPFPTPMGVIQVPTGRMQRTVRQQAREVDINEPLIEYVSLRDFYIDPNCPSPLPWDAGHCIRRRLVPIKDLARFKGVPDMDIPDDRILYTLAEQKAVTAGDEGVLYAEALRESSYNRATDYSVSGEDKRVEVLEYWTSDRLVWVFGRRHVAYNVPNPYGFIPFFNIHYVDVLDRFYALAMSDVLEPEQRLQQSIINARVDELSLSIHPPMIKRRGVPIPVSQLRRRPGLITETDDVEADLKAQEVANVTQQAYVEVAASEVRAQRRDGISELAILGTPGTPSNVGRTATGVQTLSSASHNRISGFIENAQEQAIVPFLDRLLQLNQKFNTQQDVVKILGADGQLIQLDARALINAQLRFEMRGASRMSSKAALLQVLPLVVQTLLNPEVIGMLHQEGKTVEIGEIINMVLDATSYRPHKTSLIRALSPQEQAALKEQAIDQTKMRTQSMRAQAQIENTQERAAADMIMDMMELRSKERIAKTKDKKEKKSA